MRFIIWKPDFVPALLFYVFQETASKLASSTEKIEPS